jgi:hypothetical protein
VIIGAPLLARRTDVWTKKEQSLMGIAILVDWAGTARAVGDRGSLGAEITVFRDTLHDEGALAECLAPSRSA